MKKIFIILLVILLAVTVYKDFYKGKAKPDLRLTSIMAGIKERIAKIRATGSEMVSKVTGAEKPVRKNISLESVKELIKQTDLPSKEEARAVVIYMKRGGVMRAKLLEKTDDSYIVLWKDEKYTLSISQVDHIEYGTGTNVEWKYKNSVVILKNNGIVVDGEITDVDKDTVTVIFRDGGGELEMGINKKDVDHLLFAPVWNKEDYEILESLKKFIPGAKVYNEGDITLFTDCDITWVKSYLKELNEVYTEIYFTFFKFFKGKKPSSQNFVIVFDSWNDFDKVAHTDGLCGRDVLGYFMPTDKVLYLNNFWGREFEKFYTDQGVSLNKTYDERIKQVKDSSDKIVVEGFYKEDMDNYWNWVSLHKEYATTETSNTLRHEFTHEVFNSWGLQDIVIHIEKVDKEKLFEKKKDAAETLDTNDKDKMEKLFTDITRLRKKESDALEFIPANTWYVEGLAQYCSTTPFGTMYENGIFRMQEMLRKNELNPVEFVMNFKAGSFTGLNYEAVRNAYAESWALTHFLMTRYRDKFIEFLKIVAEIRSGRGEKAKTVDELALLLKCLGIDLATLDLQFREYVKTFPAVDDPLVKKVLRYEEVYQKRIDSWQKVGGRFV